MRKLLPGLMILGTICISPLCSQNIFHTESLRVVEEHDIEGFYENRSSYTPLMPAYKEIINLYDEDFTRMIYTKMISGELELFKWPFSLFEGEGSDLMSISERSDWKQYYDLNIVDNQGNRSREIIFGEQGGIHSFMTIDDWQFEKEEFKLSKKVVGIGPVRIVEKDSINDLYSRSEDRFIVGLIRFPENLNRKYEKSRYKKKLQPYTEISYEFKLINEDWQGELDLDFEGKYWIGPRAYFLEGSSQWNKYYGVDIVNAIFYEASKDNTANQLINQTDRVDFRDLYSNLHPEDDFLSGDQLEEESIEFIQSRLKERVFSLIFREEWLIDPETLYLVKEVKTVTPVYWKIIYKEENYESDRDIALELGAEKPIYEKTPLFEIKFK